MTEVDNALEEIWKIDKNIESFSRSIIVITDAAAQADGLTELTDAQRTKIKTISMLKSEQEHSKTSQECEIFKLFDSRLGGIKASGKDEKPLGLKEDVRVEKNTPKEIQDAVSSWIKPRAGKYYACVPAILRLLKSYDKGTGMYWCPHEAHTDMARHTRPRYQQQAESLYTDLKDEIGEVNMEVVMATQMCGKQADQKVKGKEDDGISAICCMLSIEVRKVRVYGQGLGHCQEAVQQCR